VTRSATLLLLPLLLGACSRPATQPPATTEAAVRAAPVQAQASQHDARPPHSEAARQAGKEVPEALRTLDPLGIDALVVAGFEALARGDDPSAAASFLLALEGEPSHAEAHYGLGLLLVRRGRPERAVAAFAEAATHAPGLVEAHVELGVSLHARGRAHQATFAYDNALLLDPKHERARFNRALALRADGKIQAARRDLEALCESERFGAVSQVELALLRLRAGGPGAAPRALRYLRAALRRAPSDPSAHYNLGQLLLQLGQTQEGRRHLSRVGDSPYSVLAQAARTPAVQGNRPQGDRP
jgi:Flp pilus assembly protein TadD